MVGWRCSGIACAGKGFPAPDGYIAAIANLAATAMKVPPDAVKLSREAGEALIERLRANTLTNEDRGWLVKLIQLDFWFTFALRETKISLGWLQRALFGEGRRPPPPVPAGVETQINGHAL